MTYDTLLLTSQTDAAHWGWTIALFLWFIGSAGMGLFINVWVRSKQLFFISTASAIIGSLFVVSHLGRLWNLPMAAIRSLLAGQWNWGSWMFIGICLLGILCVAGLAQSFLLVKQKDGSSAVLRNPVILWSNALLGVAATAYSGFLLTQAEGIALWTTAALPILWVVSGLACAVGLVELLSATSKVEHFSWLPTTAMIVHVAEAFILFAFVHVAFSGTPGAAAAAERLLSGDMATLFWGGAAGLGLVVPFILSFAKANVMQMASAVAVLLGALCLRASVLFAGVFEPILF